MNYDQISLFELVNEKKVIKQPCRIIELFSGYGSQNLAMKHLGVDYQHYKICEWATKSIQAYNDLHIQDYTDYSKDLTSDEVVDKLYQYGISADYNSPMTKDQIKRKGERWQRTTYNNIIATNNLVNIQNVKGEDLEIVDTDKYEYLVFYSFPCQDISAAGLSKGYSKGSGTRSGMLWEVERLLDECKALSLTDSRYGMPSCLIMENVPLLIGKRHIKNFQLWVEKLESLGYSNFVEVLNAKDYGIPQNRERCFMVSILGEYSYNFPKPIKLENRLKDLLETDVDESYFLSDKMIQYIVATPSGTYTNNNIVFNRKIANTLNTGNCGQYRASIDNYIIDNVDADDIKYDETIIRVGKTNSGGQRSEIISSNGICSTLTATDFKQPKQIMVNNVNRLYGLFDKDGKKHQAGSVYDVNGLAPTLDTMNGGYREPCIEIREKTKKGFSEAHEGDGVYINRPHQKRGVVQKDMIQTLKTQQDVGVVVKVGNYSPSGHNASSIVDSNGISPCVMENYGTITAVIDNKDIELKIRKLTPKECWRLMGVLDENYEKVAKNQSKSSLYHLAGDSIVTTCLVGIIGSLFDIDYISKIKEISKNVREVKDEN